MSGGNDPKPLCRVSGRGTFGVGGRGGASAERLVPLAISDEVQAVVVNFRCAGSGWSLGWHRSVDVWWGEACMGVDELCLLVGGCVVPGWSLRWACACVGVGLLLTTSSRSRRFVFPC
uniref:Uncharacterized protein n=1 Tax=Chromera velia CCMP2878 TaxID=1169474 RepID=A0A0G4FZB4_9ALVE|eukprot:Cvel_19517.t1-p1 / transcript=Cvel_19517.t1 / gene=Cvel_19517 / organism=Chromera_velia_CCMP2878 / gene_product=hypothetical protein / transcript_product=hypothetical protein / location=Cvel_scaffold1689:20350-20700(-) / protein_length=117 / sequence_SO=supercontig / SO=protein_coding / is_pseudo=false